MAEKASSAYSGQERTAVFRDLSGGLNLQQPEETMEPDQSPDMKNLWLRDGQTLLSAQELGRGLSCYERLFWGRVICHIGDGLYAGVPAGEMTMERLCGDMPEIAGCFLHYQEDLLYKTDGAFKKIIWDGTELRAEDVEPYVPVVQINTGPDGSGDLYQPENRLTGKRTVWCSAARETRSITFYPDGTLKVFSFTTEDGEPVASVEQVYVGTTLLDPTEYAASEDGLTLTLAWKPESGQLVTMIYTVGIRTYQLPLKELESVDEIQVDDETVTDFTADLEQGTVTFSKAPTFHEPQVNNTIHITFTKDNPDARKSIQDCRYGFQYGTVLVLAGAKAQPNGYFWNGSHTAMDPGYFPMGHYNLAGDALEAVTGFGRQADYLIVFQEHSVGRCLLGTETIGGRAYLTLNYTAVNGVLGCDLPGTIRLVDNNLVWCSTYAGVCRLEDTTAALENQVRCLSRSINGCADRPGLLQAVRRGDTVCALEDGEHYWLCAGGEAYLWDHGASGPERPGWFRFTGIDAVAFLRGDSRAPELEELPFTGSRRIYHLDQAGRVSCFVRSFRDYDGAIEKVYQFPARSFGTCERYKDVLRMVITTRSDTDTVLRVRYITDLEDREDLTPIASRGTGQFAHVAVRQPKCRHVQYFSLRLENDQPGCDMAIVSAEMTARLGGRQR